MEMCPYCGEDVPSDTATCWKCGTELSEKTDDSVELRGPAAEREEERKKKKKKKPMRQCPFCETMVPLHSLRCNRCGKVLKEAGRQIQWQKGVWVAFAVVLVAVVGWLLWGVIEKGPTIKFKDRGRDEPLQVSYENLARIFLEAGGAGDDQRKATWNLEHRGRYVEWDGVVTKVVDADEGIVDVAQSTTANVDDVEVRLEFKDPDVIKQHGLKHGILIKYSARLEAYDPRGGFFTLDNAVLIK